MAVAAMLAAVGWAGLTGCSRASANEAARPGSAAASVPRDQAARALLEECLAAHGGLERYRAFGTMRYETVGFPLNPVVATRAKGTVELATRYNRIDGEGFSAGFDGKAGWKVLRPDVLAMPIRGYVLGNYYFLAFPFVFADESAVLSDGGTKRYRGKEYRVLNVGFGRGTGHHSEPDEFAIYIDPQTKRVAMANYSVKEFGLARVTWEYREWQTADGIVTPARVALLPGFEEEPTAEAKEATVENVAFETARPDAAIYAPPEGAVVEAPGSAAAERMTR